jgi:putative tryptophan/tyrosine transport system substrate-binding protein
VFSPERHNADVMLIHRRRFLAAATVLMGLPSAVIAQASVPRVAFLGLSGEGGEEVEQFKRGMRELGYVDGSNLRLEVPNLGGRYEGLPALLKELVQRDVRVIVTRGSTATNVAKKATDSVPIVMIAGLDPVKSGFAASLSRPGGNLTGITIILQEMAAKRLELLRELLAGLAHVGVLFNPESKGSVGSLEETKAVARNLELRVVQARATAELESAFAQLAAAKVQAVLTTPSTMFTANRKLICDLAVRHRLPSMFYDAEYVETGGLMSYGPDIPAACRRAAAYVDRILKGAKPGELAIEQPTKMELIINAKTAHALGMKIPQAILLRTDRVFE